jgi:hypothetical protein
LHDHLPAGRVIDFMSVDVEGLDLQVLRSNDWERYRPVVVVIEETAVSSLAAATQNECAAFMIGKDYCAIALTPSALTFLDTRSPAYDGGRFLRYLHTEQSSGR